MLTQGFGELLTDILTVNPAIKSIPSASAILDTSNYTFNAVTLGKDSPGYLQHGHTLFSVSSSYIDLPASSIIYSIISATPVFGDALKVELNNAWRGSVYFNSGILTCLRYNSQSVSSYFVSSTYLQLSSAGYYGTPQYPSVYDRRLEKKSTKTSADLFYTKSYFDYGHYANPVIVSGDITEIEPIFSSFYGTSSAPISSLWNVVGYPPSGNVTQYKLIDSFANLANPVTSGNLSGVFNTQKVIDKYGYIKINEAINTTSLSSGPYVVSSDNFPTDPGVTLGIGILRGDAVALALLGGVNHIGVWALDLKEMLKSSLNPPYSWNYLNNTRKYKLVAKVTFWDNILYHEDISTNSGLSLLDTNGVLVKLKFNFK